MCKVLEVSRSGFYDHMRSVSQADITAAGQAALEAKVREVFIKSKSTYGFRRIVAALRQQGFAAGRYRVRTLMRRLGLKAKMPRRYRTTTDSRHSHPVAPNRLDRQFAVSAANTVWAADISYVWTLEGWLFLAVVMDLFSRQIVGWAMAGHMRVQLVIDALAMAYFRRRPPAGLVHHSDRGSQYACPQYQDLLSQYQMVPSMSRKGNGWDNAPVERFFGSLKTEHLADFRFATRRQAANEVLEYITFYNAYRSHSSLGYVSPIDYENQKTRRAA